jgi:hypothetical protein
MPAFDAAWLSPAHIDMSLPEQGHGVGIGRCTAIHTILDVHSVYQLQIDRRAAVARCGFVWVQMGVSGNGRDGWTDRGRADGCWWGNRSTALKRPDEPIESASLTGVDTSWSRALLLVKRGPAHHARVQTSPNRNPGPVQGIPVVQRMGSKS